MDDPIKDAREAIAQVVAELKAAGLPVPSRCTGPPMLRPMRMHKTPAETAGVKLRGTNKSFVISEHNNIDQRFAIARLQV